MINWLVKISKNINRWPKNKQFVVLLLFSSLGTIMLLTGCGKSNCDPPQCASADDGVGKQLVISIPGCGSCGGCGTACWPKNCRLVTGSWKDVNPEGKLLACDIRYFDGTCDGCLDVEQSRYFGCLKLSSGEESENGYFKGSSEEGTEQMRNASGCTPTRPYFNGKGWQIIEFVEKNTGVEEK